ncbi:hypothetical protein DID88_000712 [Monilinia fructigena]|uniref:Uncharacterized protein n=1 Tax=Monilinia fructigena TaxID=38457 RepID=A0A395IIR8_9HELO|nr:hypothetical protein DID88_000712 [Monilinia fructigena]
MHCLSNSGTPAGTSAAAAQSTKGMENVTVHRPRNMKGKEMHSDAGPEPDRSESPTTSSAHEQELAYQRTQIDNDMLRASLQQLQEENERLRQQASLNTFPDIPPSKSHGMPAQASGSTVDPEIYPSVETDTRSNRGRRKKTKQRRKSERNPHANTAPPLPSSEPSESGRSNSSGRSGRPARKRNDSRFVSISHDSTPSPGSTYLIKPTNLTNKLSNGIEPKASLWKAMITDRLELYANTFTTEAQRRAYVVDQTESKALEHLQALYMQIPRLTGQQLVDQLADIYRNPAEVDHARSQYDHWAMPNSNTRGNFLEWYREFRLLATQAEITDEQTLMRDLDRKISDFLARAIALHRADCRTINDLAAKLTQVDEVEVTLRERNRYRVSRDTTPHSKKASNPTTHTDKNVANNPGLLPRPNYPPRMVPSGYSGTFKPGFTPNRFPNSPRPDANSPRGASKTPAPRASAFDVGEVEQVTTSIDDQEETYDAIDDGDPEAYAEAANAARQAEDLRLNEGA